ncbi:hypothetical protein IV494_07600 [Kaistella sp. G5-32]|uniref:Uncharacterized protein n=1 Tax=Kaistella gelatinilytica TaxID=2787636 RepID=A0ABS0FBF0_9FLAO|nr:hypothetical protein [Kaistella gelatinilytica]MBF8457045.1 hypothetical protein [Kaistella gelatinilytica]
MKNLPFVLLFILPTVMNAQETKQSEINQYLKKANTKKKTANILLITGGGLLLTGIVVSATAQHKNSMLISDRDLAGLGLSGLGILSAVASVPFYISAKNNKNKSLQISPTTGILRSNSITEPKNYATVGLNFNF